MAWHMQQRAEAKTERKTPVYPCELRRRRRNRQNNLRKSPRYRDHYDTYSYRQAIEYGIDKANAEGLQMPYWTPNQLRHSIATSISSEIDDHAAQRWLGHKNLATTNTYIAKQVAELIAIARAGSPLGRLTVIFTIAISARRRSSSITRLNMVQ